MRLRPTLSGLTLLALTAVPAAALAADPGHYHPDDIAAQSKRFDQAAQSMGPAFDQAQQALTRLSTALETLDAGVLLVGDRAPADLVAWAGSTRTQVTGQYLRLQRHVDLLQEDYGEQFGAALARALAAEPADRKLLECGATGISAIVGKKSCPGVDLNGVLAARVDADPALGQAVTEIAAVPWPEIGVQAQAFPPVAITGTARWVSAEALFAKVASGTVDRRGLVLEDALDPLLDRMEAGDADALAEGRAARAAYARGLAEDGTLLVTAMQDTLAKAEKRGGPAAVGLCVVPTLLGGCTGEDATAAVLATLEADKRFDKAVARLK